MTDPTTPSPRDTARLDWARAALDDPEATLERASVDAGFRSYWRSTGAAGTGIVMDSPPDREDVRPWLQVRDLLEAGGVRVPHVLARDVEHGFLLLEDLGTRTLLQVLDDGNADAQFDAAIGQLLGLQAIAPPAGLPAYDEALLSRELRLFDELFLGRHLGLAADCLAMGDDAGRGRFRRRRRPGHSGFRPRRSATRLLLAGQSRRRGCAIPLSQPRRGRERRWKQDACAVSIR